MLLMRWMTLTKCKESSNSNDDDMQMATGWPPPSAHIIIIIVIIIIIIIQVEKPKENVPMTALSQIFFTKEKIKSSSLSYLKLHDLNLRPNYGPGQSNRLEFFAKGSLRSKENLELPAVLLFCSKPLLHIELCVNPPLFRPAAKWQGFAKTPQTSSSSEDDRHKKVADFLSHCQLCPIVGAL